MQKIGNKEWFIFVISLLIITDLAIFLNIPFLRQILGFLFLTILPGLLILQILKLNKIGSTEKFVLSVGLSISFMMFFGLLINNLSLGLDYQTPLSTISLLIAFNLAFIVLGIIGYKIKTFEKSFIKTSDIKEIGSIRVKNWLPNLKLSTSEKAFLIVPVIFPALSIFGTYFMNTTNNDVILMFLLFLIPIYVAFICFFNQKFPKRLYPVVIFLISLSLLLLLSLRSNHIIGIDTHTEYYFFQITLDNLHWRVLTMGTSLDACLSISLLPTIYQSILNVNLEYLFKLLYPVIYSITPLIVYVISRKYVRESYAFLASIFFMFQHIFIDTTMKSRSSIAVLFFALAMMVLFNDEIDPIKKRILFIVFTASCIVSHYSTTYIFFFILLGTLVGMEILSKKYTFKKNISLTFVILSFAMIFFWYSQITETAFTSGVGFIEDTLTSLNRFFIEESRAPPMQELYGGWLQKSIPFKIEFVFMWLTFVFIGLGVITLIRRYKEMSFPDPKFKKSDFLKEKFEVGYFMIALVCVGLLIVMFSLPYISKGYGIDRLYAVAITLLSVFFVIGGITLSKHFFFLQKKTCAKRKSINQNASQVRAYLIILLILIPYFLCVTGVMYNIFSVPRSIILNSEGKFYDMLYVHDQESNGAKWLKVHSEDKTKVYTDFYRFGLISQAGFSPRSINWDHLVRHEKIDGYIYLRYYNVVNDKLVGRNESSYIFTFYNLTEYDDVFVGKNKIYNNGGSEVYR